jgi:hypothetical protein
MPAAWLLRTVVWSAVWQFKQRSVPFAGTGALWLVSDWKVVSLTVPVIRLPMCIPTVVESVWHEEQLVWPL